MFQKVKSIIEVVNMYKKLQLMITVTNAKYLIYPDLQT